MYGCLYVSFRDTSFFDEFSNKYLNLCGKDITDNSVICMGFYFSLHGPVEKNLSR